jgi:hypothetical protein
MKNLVSKIGKAILIPALALSLGVQKSSAQDEQHRKIEFTPVVNFGFGGNLYSGFKLYDNWQNHFVGLDGDEELKQKTINPYANLDVGFDLGILNKDNKNSFGLNVTYSLFDKAMNRDVACVELHNWNFDYVKIHELVLKDNLPSLGVYFKGQVGRDNYFLLRGSLRKAEFTEIKREDPNIDQRDQDSKSNLKCAPTPIDNTNELTRVFETNKTKSLVSKLGVEILGEYDELNLGAELYYETDWKKFHSLGLTLNFYLNNLFNKED